MSYDLQNFYKSTLLLDWTIGTGNFYVTTKPTVSTGWLVISPNNSSLREIVKFTATGTDSNGDYVTVSVRGVGGTTEQVHTQGEPIRMNITAEYWDDMNQEIADIVASGVPNANTTTMGGVQEATAVQIDAYTQAGSTGAELFVNPKLLSDAHNIPTVVPSTSGNVMTSNGTDWISSTPVVPFIVQDIPLLSGAYANTNFSMAQNSTNTVYVAIYGSASNTLTIARIIKDTTTGNFYITHTTTLASLSAIQGTEGVAIVGNYVYVAAVIGGNNAFRRYDLADLANVTTMTISGTAVGGPMFSDGTSLYVYKTANIMTKFTISGTTITNNSDITYTSSGAVKSCACDGTNVWLSDGAGTGATTIRKYTLAGGSATSTLSIILNSNAYYNATVGTAAYPTFAIVGTNTIGIGWGYNNVSATTVVGLNAHLMAIAL